MCDFFTLPPVGLQSIVISMSVCLFVCLPLASNTTRPNFTVFSVHVTCGHGSVLLGLQGSALCTFSFVDDVMF